MRLIITTIIILSTSFLSKGQSLNLVPVDSANFVLITDSLVDEYFILPDSIKFNTETYKTCPCAIDSIKGLLSYKSTSFIINNNRCLFLYISDSVYYTQVGQLTNTKDEFGKLMWQFSIKKMKKEIAEQYIKKTTYEISKAEIPKLKEFVFTNDRVSHTFGDLKKNKYATTPITDLSNSIIELIRFSEKLIKTRKIR